MKHLSEVVGAFIMQGSEEMYRFDIKEISKEDALKMIQKYHYSNTLPKINKYFLGFFLDKELVGVVTLGWGTRPRHTIQRIFPSLDTKDYLEIGRMCMTEELKEESNANIQSETGILKRQTRSIQTEGHFGDIKENEDFRRFNYRSGEKVYKEFMLYAIGRNIMKYHRFLHHEIEKYEGKKEQKAA